jgi:tetratricopeptide (TPR) repeat protein
VLSWQVSGSNVSATTKASIEQVEAQVAALRTSVPVDTGILARRLAELARMKASSGELAQAESHISEAISLYRRLGHRRARGWCLRTLAGIVYQRRGVQYSHPLLESALDLFRAAGDLAGQAQCLESLGDLGPLATPYEQGPPVVGGVLGDAVPLRMPEAYYEEALDLYRRLGDARGMAYCCQRLGSLARDRTDYEHAQRHYQEAARLYHAQGAFVDEAGCHSRRGFVARQLGHEQMALDCYREARDLYHRLGYADGEAGCVTAMGWMAYLRQDSEAAQACYKEALEIYRHAGDLVGEASCLRRLGSIARRRGDEKAAELRYQEALACYRQAHHARGQATCLERLGDMAFQRTNYHTARVCWEEALGFYQKAEDQKGASECLSHLRQLSIHVQSDAVVHGHHEAIARVRRSAQGDFHEPLATLAHEMWTRFQATVLGLKVFDKDP